MIHETEYGEHDGKALMVYRLENQKGHYVEVINYGARITAICVPDRGGQLGDVVLGMPTLDSYLQGRPYHGATVGRYANRIKLGRFTLNGIQYQVDCNNFENHVHGGFEGFDRKVWDSTIENDTVKLHYVSPDGECGYPGNLDTTVTVSFSEDDGLTLDYQAVCDADTVINLTNHSFFNLSNEDTILNHQVQILADCYTPIDSKAIPTGEIAPVEGTPFDFRQTHRVGDRVGEDNAQLSYGHGGYDHNYVLNGTGMRECARVYAPDTGRTMTVITDKPGLQFYTGNSISNVAGKNGAVYGHYCGMCLEAQFFPDSPNHSNFCDCVLKKGEVYHYTTVYQFGVEK